MADSHAGILIEELEVDQGGLPAALATVASGNRCVLLRWPGVRLSPLYNQFLSAIVPALADHHEVAGFSLAVPRLRPATAVPFVPVEDGFDAVYLQRVPLVAIALTPAQAGRAAQGLLRHGSDLSAFLTSSGSYFATPRAALAHDGRQNADQQRLFPIGERAWRISAPESALALYDSRLEIAADAARRIGPTLANYDFLVDLWGERPAGEGGGRLLLSSRPCRAPILSFSLEFTPIEANLVDPVDGGFFSLGNELDFAVSDRARGERLFRHATRFNAMDDYANQFVAPIRRVLRLPKW